MYTAAQSLTVVSQLLGPAAVRSQAAGIGVIWLSSLYRNQVGEYALSSVIVSSVEPTALMFVTFAGKAPGLKSNQSCGTPFIMLIQNMTSCAVTGAPFDHL